MEAELLAAIAAAPDDMAPRLVYADYLLSSGDERGELITYDDADRRGHFQRFVDDPALYRFMQLAARHGFMRWPSDPDDAVLWEPVRDDAYRCTFEDTWYVAEGNRVSWFASARREHDGARFPNAMELALYGVTTFTPREIEVFLAITSRAIRQRRALAEIIVPYREAIAELDRLWPDRPTHDHALFGVVDHERWGILWQRWFRRP